MSSDASPPSSPPAPNGAAVLALLAARVVDVDGDRQLREVLTWVRGLPAHVDANDGSAPAP